MQGWRHKKRTLGQLLTASPVNDIAGGTRGSHHGKPATFKLTRVLGKACIVLLLLAAKAFSVCGGLLVAGTAQRFSGYIHFGG